MIDWQSVVVRLNKLLIGNLKLVSHVTLTKVISFTSSVPSIPRTGLRFDMHNEKRSCPLFDGYCRSLAKSLLVFPFQGKKGVSLQHHLKIAILMGIKGKLMVLVIRELRENRMIYLNCCSFFLPV